MMTCMGWTIRQWAWAAQILNRRPADPDDLLNRFVGDFDMEPPDPPRVLLCNMLGQVTEQRLRPENITWAARMVRDKMIEHGPMRLVA